MCDSACDALVARVLERLGCAQGAHPGEDRGVELRICGGHGLGQSVPDATVAGADRVDGLVGDAEAIGYVLGAGVTLDVSVPVGAGVHAGHYANRVMPQYAYRVTMLQAENYDSFTPTICRSP